MNYLETNSDKSTSSTILHNVQPFLSSIFKGTSWAGVLDTVLTLILQLDLTRKKVGVDMTIHFREEFYISGTRYSTVKKLNSSEELVGGSYL